MTNLDEMIQADIATDVITNRNKVRKLREQQKQAQQASQTFQPKSTDRVIAYSDVEARQAQTVKLKLISEVEGYDRLMDDVTKQLVAIGVVKKLREEKPETPQEAKIRVMGEATDLGLYVPEVEESRGTTIVGVAAGKKAFNDVYELGLRQIENAPPYIDWANGKVKEAREDGQWEWKGWPVRPY